MTEGVEYGGMEMTPEALHDALRTCGVPTTVRHGLVVVPGSEPVDPGVAHNQRKVAERWVREQTSKVIGRLEYRVNITVSQFPGTHVERKSGGINVSVDGKHVARVDRFRVRLPNGRTLAAGNLLMDAEPLQVLQNAVKHAISRLGPRRASAGNSATDWVLITDWIASPDKRLARRAIAASRHLRLHRSVVPASRIEVLTTRGRVTFERLVEGQNPLELRFAYRYGKRRLNARLCLTAPNDPLALWVDDDSDPESCTFAWAIALITYARICCVESSPSGKHVQVRNLHGRVGGRHHGGTSTTLGGASQAQGTSSVIELATLDQAAAEIRMSVRGHRRRLNPGEHRSPEAEKNARAVGISLPAGYTWVRAHSRGDRLIRVGGTRPVKLW